MGIRSSVQSLVRRQFRAGRPRPASGIVAAAVVVIALIAGVVFITSSQPSSSAATGPSAPPATSLTSGSPATPAQAASPISSDVVGPEVVGFGLIDAAHGWARAGGPLGMDLYLTADGGRSWRHAVHNLNTLVAFSDPMHGWVGPSGLDQIVRTSDGGATWQTISTPASSWPFDLHFFDETDGVIALRYPASVWSTKDGGSHWTQSGALPDAIVGPMSWASPTIGWAQATSVPGNIAGEYLDQIYVTRDGGRTWSRSPLPTPSSVRVIHVGQPVLRGPVVLSENSALVASSFPEVTQLLVTRDAGRTWSVVREIPFGGPLPIARAGGTWVMTVPVDVGGTSVSTIQVTADEGRSWREIARSDRPRATFADVAFADPLHGWVLLKTGSVGHLFGTSDGGASWQLLSPDQV